MRYILNNNIIIKPQDNNYFTVKTDGKRISLKVGDMVVLILQQLFKLTSYHEIINIVSEQYKIPYNQANLYCSKIITELSSQGIISQTEEESVKCKGKIIYRDSNRLSRAVLIITNNCNFSCLHCDVDSGINLNKTKEISITDISSLLPSLINLGVNQVIITGGEPFLKPDFEKLLIDLSKYDFNVILYTNGSLISSKLCKLLSSINNIRIQIPLDGITQKTHDFLRKYPGAFKKAIQSIKLLKKHGIRVSVGTVIYKQNLKEMKDFPKFLNSLGVNEWVVSTLMKIGRAISNENIHLSDKEFKRFLITFFAIQNDFPSLKVLNNIFDSVESKFTGNSCNLWKESITITPNGDVIPCERLPYMMLGNIKEQTITEILQKEDLITQHKEFIKSLRILCENCDSKKLCGCGCPGAIISNKVHSPCGELVDPISCKFFMLLKKSVILQKKLRMSGE